jgi:hypothetical protein
MPESVVVSIEADAAPFEATMRQLEGLSRNFGSQLTSGLKSAVAGGKELDDILRRVGLNLAGMAFDRAMRPVENLMGSFFSSLLGGLTPFARGGVPSASAPIIPFASGGVVSAPTFFPMGSRMGVDGRGGRGSDHAFGAHFGRASRRRRQPGRIADERHLQRQHAGRGFVPEIRGAVDRHAGAGRGARHTGSLRKSWQIYPAFTMSAFRWASPSARPVDRNGATRSSA